MSAAIVLDWAHGGKRCLWDNLAEGKLPRIILMIPGRRWVRTDINPLDDAERAVRADVHGRRACKSESWIDHYDPAATVPRAGPHHG